MLEAAKRFQLDQRVPTTVSDAALFEMAVNMLLEIRHRATAAAKRAK